MFYSVVTNALFICRVEKGVETSVYITEFAVIRILALYPKTAVRAFEQQALTRCSWVIRIKEGESLGPGSGSVSFEYLQRSAEAKFEARYKAKGTRPIIRNSENKKL